MEAAKNECWVCSGSNFKSGSISSLQENGTWNPVPDPVLQISKILVPVPVPTKKSDIVPVWFWITQTKTTY
jgi:hypothetical protein